jgi:hypothetical protein
MSTVSITTAPAGGELWCPTDRFLVAFRYEPRQYLAADEQLPDSEAESMKKSIVWFALYWDKPYRHVPMPDGTVMLVLECNSARELRNIDVELDWIRFRFIWVQRRLSEQLRTLARTFLVAKLSRQVRDAAERYAHDRGMRLAANRETITVRDPPPSGITVEDFVTEAREKGLCQLDSWRDVMTVKAMLVSIEVRGTFETRAMKV